MRKTRIEVKTDLVADINAHEIGKLAADDWHDNSLDIADGNKDKVDVNSANIDLAELGVYTEVLLIDSIRKACYRWMIENYINSSRINIIIILTTYLKPEISTNKKDSIPVRHYQVAEIDRPDKSNINNISENNVVLWQEIIHWSGYLIDKEVNTGDIDNPCKITYQYPVTEMLEPIFDETRMSKTILTKIKRIHFSNNTDPVILYDIIQDQPSLNTL